jgi:DNA-binding NtrC family response regulator
MLKRLLITWSDRGADSRAPAHHGQRPATDCGPVMRLWHESGRQKPYDKVVIVAPESGRRGATRLLADLAQVACEARVHLLTLDDPSDYEGLFALLAPLASALDAEHPEQHWQCDVLLSAGTPQVQTIWFVLRSAGLLRARLLQVIPAEFVPVPHRKAVREVKLDIEGFPEIRALRSEVQKLRLAEKRQRGGFVADAACMQLLVARTERVAASELPVLVLGETGTGKELIARMIHDSSGRAQGPYVAENCGAVAESVIASELFGHEAHAFTGANARHIGLLERAHGGTLFLDEVGELPLPLQAMLLRVIETGTLRRVGGERNVHVNLRVVAATHRDLLAMVARGTFREDLYYRLRGAELVVPSLRERVGDIPQLITAFERAARGGGKRLALDITPAAMAAVMAYFWPGNVRELRSEVMRWAVFAEGRVDLEDLSPEILQMAALPHGSRRTAGSAAQPATLATTTLGAAVEYAERHAIIAALAAHQHNIAQTSRALGIERNTLKRKLRQYAL